MTRGSIHQLITRIHHEKKTKRIEKRREINSFAKYQAQENPKKDVDNKSYKKTEITQDKIEIHISK